MSSPSSPDARPAALPWLQALRAVAALAVVFLHVTQEAGGLAGQPGAGQPGAGRPGVAPYGWLRPLPWDAGVDVFFVISGFVMLWSSRPLFARPGGARLFLGRRIARVVPLYWLLTAALVAGALLRPGLLSEPLRDAWVYILASFLFVPMRRPDGFIQPVFRLGWTLNYEMFFYALFAACLRFRAAVAVPAIVAALLALAACGRVLRPAWTPLAFWTDSIVLEFGYGVLLAAAALGGARLPRPLRLLLVVAAVGALVADESTGLPRGIAWGLPAAALVAAGALGAPILAGPWLRAAVRLGDASYALYLVHPFPMRLLARVWPAGNAAGVLGYIATATLASVLLALALHRWIERPLTRAMRHLLRAAAW